MSFIFDFYGSVCIFSCVCKCLACDRYVLYTCPSKVADIIKKIYK